MNPPNPISEKKWETRFWFLNISFLAVRFFLAVSLDLAPDEAYYWEFSRRLDFSYFDHPPMVGYFIAASKFLFGDTPFAIRFPTLISFFIINRIVFLLGKMVDGSCKTGFISTLALQLTPASLALGFVTTPDVPLALFWSLASWAFLECLKSNKIIFWLGLGFSLGAGALSKYNMIFICPGIAAVILGFPKFSHLIFTRRFWMMFFFAVLGTFPVLWWNFQHDWVSFRFQFSHGLTAANRTFWVNLGEFLGGQFGTIGLTLFPVLCWQMLIALYRGWKEEDHIKFSLAAIGFPLLTFFAISEIRSKVEANWPQMAYLTLIPLAGAWLNHRQKKSTYYLVLLPSAIIALVGLLQALTSVIPIPPRSDITTRLHGWSAMGETIRKIDRQTNQRVLFIAQGAPLTALVAFYGLLPPNRIAEVNGKGQWKYWWMNWDKSYIEPPFGSDAVFVDDNRNSEVNFIASFYQEKLASESILIKKNNRELRTLNFTHFRNYLGGLNFDLLKAN